MILFIIILNLVISLAVLFLIRKGKIVKYSRIFKYINIVHISSIGLLVFLDLYIVENRASGIFLFFIYALLGAIVLILNVIFLLRNYFSKK